MLLDIEYLLSMDFKSAARFVMLTPEPAVLLDGKSIVRRRSASVRECVPFIRCGARIDKFIGTDDAEVVRSLRPGQSRTVASMQRLVYGFTAVRSAEHCIMFFDTVGVFLRAALAERYAAMPGYDNGFSTGIAEKLLSPRIRSPFTERMNRHLAEIVGRLSGVAGVNAPEWFNVADALRGVAAAENENTSARGYRFSEEKLPYAIYASGTLRDFVMILSVAASDCAYMSADGNVNIGFTASKGIADVRVSALTPRGPEWLEALCRERIDRRSLVDDPTGLLPDVYLMRLLAAGNVWELTASHTVERYTSRFTFDLRFPITDRVFEGEFILSDSRNLSIAAIVERENEFLPALGAT